MYNRFTLEKRKQLEDYLKKKYRITDIGKLIGMSRQSIYTELKKGLDADDVKKRLYRNYSADRAQSVAEHEQTEAAVRRIR